MTSFKPEKNEIKTDYLVDLELSELEQISGGFSLGFGGFKPRDRKQREGRNPKTGETMVFRL